MPGAGRRVEGRWPVQARACLVAALLVAVASGCGGPEDGAPLPEPDPPSQTGPDLSDADLWLSFEDDSVGYDGATEFPDALDGPFAGRVVTANDGTVERVPGADGSGAAVAFPAKCTAPVGCPRAMVEVMPDPALNPGEGAFEYGATVWLAPDQTTTGSNIMQKGRFGTAGGLWKLQVDNDAGKPSCVVGSGTDLVTVRSSVSISDSAWHRVVCRRDGTGLSIQVDDTVDQEDARAVSVSNEWPVRVGSPGVGDEDDQFHGRLDDVYLKIAQ